MIAESELVKWPFSFMANVLDDQHDIYVNLYIIV